MLPKSAPAQKIGVAKTGIREDSDRNSGGFWSEFQRIQVGIPAKFLFYHANYI